MTRLEPADVLFSAVIPAKAGKTRLDLADVLFSVVIPAKAGLKRLDLADVLFSVVIPAKAGLKRLDLADVLFSVVIPAKAGISDREFGPRREPASTWQAQGNSDQATKLSVRDGRQCHPEIPAFAGMTRLDPADVLLSVVIPAKAGLKRLDLADVLFSVVIPAKAGISDREFGPRREPASTWQAQGTSDQATMLSVRDGRQCHPEIPAFAGMTRLNPADVLFSVVIPAKAGISDKPLCFA